jgi:hypothetical protein
LGFLGRMFAVVFGVLYVTPITNTTKLKTGEYTQNYNFMQNLSGAEWATPDQEPFFAEDLSIHKTTHLEYLFWFALTENHFVHFLRHQFEGFRDETEVVIKV